MYDPSVGRFFSKDPVAGTARNPSTLNPYSYVGNNPANRVNPSGRFWFLAGAAIGAVAGGGLYVATHWDQIQQGKANWVEAAAYAGTGAIIGTGVGAVADMVCIAYVGLGLLPAGMVQTSGNTYAARHVPGAPASCRSPAVPSAPGPAGRRRSTGSLHHDCYPILPSQ